MSGYEKAKAALTRAMGNKEDQSVVVLSGKWGTGKTHIWRTYEKGLVKGSYVYVSLFGLKSTRDVQLRMIQAKAVADGGLIKAGVGHTVATWVQKFFGVSKEDALLMWLPDALL